MHIFWRICSIKQWFAVFFTVRKKLALAYLQLAIFLVYRTSRKLPSRTKPKASKVEWQRTPANAPGTMMLIKFVQTNSNSQLQIRFHEIRKKSRRTLHRQRSIQREAKKKITLFMYRRGLIKCWKKSKLWCTALARMKNFKVRYLPGGFFTRVRLYRPLHTHT